MAEMEHNRASSDKPTAPENRSATPASGLDTEDEKERTIAKAALSIAELGVFLESMLLIPVSYMTPTSFAVGWPC